MGPVILSCKRLQNFTKLLNNVCVLGDQFCPAMRAGWLSYIRCAYQKDNSAYAGPVMGEGMLMVQD